MVATQPKATWEGLFPDSLSAEELHECHTHDYWAAAVQASQRDYPAVSLDHLGRRRIFVSAPGASSHESRLVEALAAINASPESHETASVLANASGAAVEVEEPLNAVSKSLGTAAYLATKRVLDATLSLLALVALSPLLLVVGCLVRLTSRGPMIYAHPRVGENGKQFTCYKFRTMVADAEALKAAMEHLNAHSDSRTFKMENDPRITRIGNFLRRSSIDELPQLVNVLWGDMSLVGPRPAIPEEVALYSDEDCRRLAVKPGLTCIWQVSGRSNLAFPEQVRLDQEYVARRSLWLDLRLIALTIPAVLRSDGAY